MPDEIKKCVDCGKDWTLTEGERKFFDEKGLTPPKRCKPCRAAKKQQKGGSRPPQESQAF